MLGFGQGFHLRRVQLAGGEPAAQVQQLHGVALLAPGGHARLGNIDGFPEGGGAMLATAAVEMKSFEADA